MEYTKTAAATDAVAVLGFWMKGSLLRQNARNMTAAHTEELANSAT